MNISNSKKQLAKIISENGGWCEGALWASQDKEHGLIRNVVSFYMGERPWFNGGTFWRGNDVSDTRIVAGGLVKNWHQTVLSSDEYFHLYPAPDADGWIEWKGGEHPVDGQTMIDVKFRYGACATSGADCFNFTHDDHKASDIIAYRLHKPERQQSTAVGDDETNLAAKEELEALKFKESPEQRAKLAKIYAPSIEQLAADYRAKLAIAQKAQEEAESHRCGAELALERLIAAGKALGLVLSVADAVSVEPEPELVITDWRDLRVGDEVECVQSNIERNKYNGMVGRLRTIDESDTSTPYLVDFGGETRIWCHEVKFIRRP